MKATLLADDVLIVSEGSRMVGKLARALNQTHEYLHDMGATNARTWLHDTWWPHIASHIEVIEDFRYLGAHLSAGTGRTSRTLRQRWEKALIQLRKLKYVPAVSMAKVRAITAKIYAAAFYGIEASGIPDRDIAQMSAAVIDVFRSKNDMHNADWFYASDFDDDKDIDPNSHLLCRRALQLRRCYCKQERSLEKYQAILRRYVRSSKQQPPVWYHDIEEHGIKAPETFPTPQQHPSRKSTNENWKMDLMEEGPIGLLILAALRAGLKIDNQFCIWQQKEEPVDVLNIPYQCLQPQLLQMLARTRTRARSQAEGDKPSLKELAEIDQIATKVRK